MKRKILLPTDFSENAWSAIKYAIKLYDTEPCTFYLLHTWVFMDSGTRTYITTSHVDELKEKSEKELKALKEKARTESNNPEHTFKTLFCIDDFLKSIELNVEKHNIDMIIMGTKGSSGINQFLFGSNTVALIDNIESCPILAVPDAFEFVTPKYIAFPTAYNHFYGDELEPLKDLSKLYCSKIRVFHVNEKKNLSEKQNYNFTMLKAYLEDYPNSFHWAKGGDKKEMAINTFIEEFKIDILTMINYKHSFIENFMKEPIIKQIGFHPKVPFLVVPSIS
jgi:nucleotide-binding universal stress UspA family protein